MVEQLGLDRGVEGGGDLVADEEVGLGGVARRAAGSPVAMAPRTASCRTWKWRPASGVWAIAAWPGKGAVPAAAGNVRRVMPCMGGFPYAERHTSSQRMGQCCGWFLRFITLSRLTSTLLRPAGRMAGTSSCRIACISA